MNLDPTSSIGLEIFKLIEYFMEHYLTKKQSSVSMQGSNMGINYDQFQKIVGKSCIID